MNLYFDVETTGLPTNPNAPSFDVENWPRLVQMAYLLEDEDAYVVDEGNFIVTPEDFIIPLSATDIHGISQGKANREGSPIKYALSNFLEAAERADMLIAHNMQFDLNVILAEANRLGVEAEPLYTKKKVCTMKRATQYYNRSMGDGEDYKWPKLQELFYLLFDDYYEMEHNAEEDVKALRECYHKLVDEDIIKLMDLWEHSEKLETLYDLFTETRSVSSQQVLYLLSKINDLWLEIEFAHYANATELRTQCKFILGFLTAISCGGSITDIQQEVLFNRLYSLISLLDNTNEEDVVIPYLKIEEGDRRWSSGYSGGYFPSPEDEITMPTHKAARSRYSDDEPGNAADDDLPF